MFMNKLLKFSLILFVILGFYSIVSLEHIGENLKVNLISGDIKKVEHDFDDVIVKAANLNPAFFGYQNYFPNKIQEIQNLYFEFLSLITTKSAILFDGDLPSIDNDYLKIINKISQSIQESLDKLSQLQNEIENPEYQIFASPILSKEILNQVSIFKEKIYKLQN